MAFTQSNTPVADHIAIVGLLIYFREGGTGDFIDMGYVQNPQRAVDQQQNEIQSARDGKLQTVKIITTSVSKSLTFETMSSEDPDVLALHRGGVAGGTAVGQFIPDDVTPTAGDMIVVQKNAETGGDMLVEYRPSVNIVGTDEQSGDGENPAILTFEATILADEVYSIPAALDAGTPAAPLGFSGIVPLAQLAAFLDAAAG